MSGNSNPLRGAVVGCRMGRAHARAMADLAAYELTAVCDADLRRAIGEAGHKPVQAFGMGAAMLFAKIALQSTAVIGEMGPVAQHELIIVSTGIAAKGGNHEPALKSAHCL